MAEHGLTKKLAGACFFDRDFRNVVIRQLVERRHELIPVSPDVHLPVVGRYALEARNYDSARDVLLGSMALLFLFIYGGCARETLGAPLPLHLLFEPSLFSWTFEEHAYFWIVVAAYLAFSAAVLLSHRYKAIDANLATLRNVEIGAESGPKVADPAHAARLKRLEAKDKGATFSAARQSSNFVGVGKLLDRRSMAVDLTKPATTSEAIRSDFDVDELYEQIARSFEALGLCNAVTSHRLVVDGRAIRDDLRVCGHPLAEPAIFPNAALLRQAMRGKAAGIVHYQCFQCGFQGNDGTLSTLISIRRSGDFLYLAEKFFYLPPPDPLFSRWLDRPIRPTAWLFLKRTVAYLVLGPLRGFWLLAIFPFATLKLIADAINDFLQRQRILDEADWDFSTVSIREAATVLSRATAFDMIDVQRTCVLLDKAFIRTASAFLEGHGIDPCDLEEGSKGVVNSGVMISGGDLSVSNLAVGNHAVAKVGRLAKLIWRGRERSAKDAA